MDEKRHLLLLVWGTIFIIFQNLFAALTDNVDDENLVTLNKYKVLHRVLITPLKNLD